MEEKGLSKLAFWLSVLFVVFAAVGRFGWAFWLTSTQWVVSAGVLAAWAVYLNQRSVHKKD